MYVLVAFVICSAMKLSTLLCVFVLITSFILIAMLDESEAFSGWKKRGPGVVPPKRRGPKFGWADEVKLVA